MGHLRYFATRTVSVKPVSHLTWRPFKNTFKKSCTDTHTTPWLDSWLIRDEIFAAFHLSFAHTLLFTRQSWEKSFAGWCNVGTIQHLLFSDTGCTEACNYCIHYHWREQWTLYSKALSWFNGYSYSNFRDFIVLDFCHICLINISSGSLQHTFL